MGNEITKKYDMSEEPSATGGLSGLWKIYSAKDKASGAPVSVHVFKKEDLKDLDKALREQVLDILRREMKTLSSVSSRPHPSILHHIERFEENRSILAFVTERVACSLADAIGEGRSGLSPQASSMLRRNFEEYEIARGFFGLVEALQFVHTIKRRVHLNLAPESIFLSPSGQFKLGGFGFSVDLPSDGSSTTPCPYFQTGARTGFEGMWRLHPVMAYSSPEATAPAGSSDVSCASDMFSLGCLMYQFCRDDPRRARLVTCDPTPQAHQTFCATLDFPGRLDVSPLYHEVQSLVSSLLQTNPAARPQLGSVTINPFFHGKEVTVLKTIDGIPQRNPAEAATFLTSIRSAVTRFPPRVQRDCIMHALLDVCAGDGSERLWGSALPIITDVCQRLDRKEIVANVQAKFSPALKAKPPEALLSLVLAMPLFLEKMEVAFFRSDVVPMVCRALQAQGSPDAPDSSRKAVEVHETTLKAITEEAFHRAIDGRTRELDILPRICWLVVKTSNLRIKVNALLCLSKTFHFYQVRAVVDKILPTLKFAAERDQTVAVQLSVLGCYEAVSKRLDKLGPVATHILPACTPMLACQGLNSNQFDMVVGVVQGMMKAVIEYRKDDIANPKSSNFNTQVPTHPGGVPDEQEIEKARLIALGGWKRTPPGSSPRPASKSQASAALPASSPRSASNATGVTSSQPAFDLSDMGLSLSPKPSPAAGSVPCQDFPFASAVVPKSHVAGPSAPTRGGASGAGALGGSSPTASVFKDFPKAQPAAASGRSSPELSPHSGGGFTSGFGSGSVSGVVQSASSGNLSWMDDIFSNPAGRPPPAVSNTGVERRSPTGSSTTPASMMGMSGSGATVGIPPAPMAGIRPPPPPPPGGAAADDPFGAFFSAAVSGGGGLAGNTAMAGTLGSQVGAAAVQSIGRSTGAAQSRRSTANSLEDQLAKTQREIAQLTRELGGGVNGNNVPGMTASGTGVQGGAWGMQGGFGGGAEGMGKGMMPSGSTPMQPHTPNPDPFAFLDSTAAGGQSGAGPSGTSDTFDWLGRR